MIIEVGLVNNGTLLADRLFNGLGISLRGSPISGDGTWKALKEGAWPGGVLSVEAAATAGGTWILDSSATIRFDAASTDLAGDFQISAGTLDINQDFITSGSMHLSGGKIEVAAGMQAQFFDVD